VGTTEDQVPVSEVFVVLGGSASAVSVHVRQGDEPAAPEPGVLLVLRVYRPGDPGEDELRLALSSDALAGTIAQLIAAGGAAFGQGALIDAMGDVLGVPDELRQQASHAVDAVRQQRRTLS
jgi:hypothetical protein